MPLDDFSLKHSLRVRWSEVDPQSIVFNPHYLTYSDVAITEYWRAIGIDYATGFAALGIDTVVAKSTLQYRAPARFDDELVVAVRCLRMGRTSLTMGIEIARGQQTLVDVEIIYVIVRPGDHAPTPIPSELRARILAFEHRPPEGA